MQRYIRPLEEVKRLMRERARAAKNPFNIAPFDVAEAERAVGALASLDRDAWAETFSSFARPYAERAREAEAKGDAARAAENHLKAYGYYRAARYPAPNSPKKKEAYRLSQEHYLAAARAFDPPIERVEMTFRGRPGEGSAIVAYLRRPRTGGRLPLVIDWGGIDSFKEERHPRTNAYAAHGLATLAIDMPGVGDAPLAGSEDAERMWDAIFDWVAAQPGLDSRRVVITGGSTGGYWAAKLAHTHRERILAAVNHGGCAHYAFTPEWIEKAQHGEYPLELAETLAYAFGRRTFEEWVEYAPRLSLLTQGVLDRPSAPLLCVNGLNDSVFPIQDHYLLLEHGEPKSARFFAAGHMGGPGAEETIVKWVVKRIEAAR
jgi:esterase FrsA